MKLNPGEMECSGCNGTGKMNKSTRIITTRRPYISTTSTESFKSFTCTKCHGSGKLDWIENVVGKRNRDLVINPSIIHSSNDFPDTANNGDLLYHKNHQKIYCFFNDEWQELYK